MIFDEISEIMEEPENEEKKDSKGGRTEERGEKQKGLINNNVLHFKVF